MNNYAILSSKLNLLQKNQPDHFQTTSFWEKATCELMPSIEDQRLKNFRRDKACLSYFIPTYGPPGLGLPDDIFERIYQTEKDLTKKQIATVKNFFDGTTQAISDRRAINACIEALGFDPFKDFIESSVGHPIEHHNIEGMRISRPMANYMLGLLFVLSHLKTIKLETIARPIIYWHCGFKIDAYGTLLQPRYLKQTLGSISITYQSIDIRSTKIWEYQLTSLSWKTILQLA